MPADDVGASKRTWTDLELTEIYNQANGITVKNPPITTERVFAAMRRMAEVAGTERLKRDIRDDKQ